jgi:hypothetical protein
MRLGASTGSENLALHGILGMCSKRSLAAYPSHLPTGVVLGRGGFGLGLL